MNTCIKCLRPKGDGWAWWCQHEYPAPKVLTPVQLDTAMQSFGLPWWERHRIGGWLTFIGWGVALMAACLVILPAIALWWLLSLVSLAVLLVSLAVWLFTLFIRPNLKGH